MGNRDKRGPEPKKPRPAMNGQAVEAVAVSAGQSAGYGVARFFVKQPESPPGIGARVTIRTMRDRSSWSGSRNYAILTARCAPRTCVASVFSLISWRER